MKSTYIMLPALKSIQVENYHLFSKNWSYNLHAGMNLFVGTNGLGKTTTTSLIIYGMVGPNSEIPMEYFENRGGESSPKFYPTIKLIFSVGDHEFEIHRVITEDTILYLRVDEHEYHSKDFDNIDDIYDGLLKQYTGIESISDITFLLQKFLIRQEEGNYLIWDDKGGDQSKLIRILINEAGFQAEYERLAKDVKDLDTSVRGKTDVKAQFTKKIKELELLRSTELEKRQDYNQRSELEKSLLGVKAEYEKNLELQEKNLENIKYLTGLIKESDGKIEVVSAEYELHTDQIRDLESRLFKHVYSDESVLTSIHKLKHYGICIYCNKTPKVEVVKEIINKLEIRNQCPVCESGLDLVHPDLDNTQVLEELEASQKKLGQAKEEIEPLKVQKVELVKQVDALWIEQRIIEKEINANAIKQYDLNIQLSTLNKNPEEQITEYDTQISGLQTQVLNYEKEIEPERDKWERAKERLNAKNDELNEVISSFEDKLNAIFVKYASKYFKPDCKLTTIERRPKESKINVKSYVPEFEEKTRFEIKNCSTSERIFLEYLFRISLLELYQIESKNSPFIIMETTEGAFDISNTIELASSFNEFGDIGLPFILITNFSKPDFLQKLSEGIGKSKHRLLNYLEFGKLSDIQKKSVPEFRKVLRSLKLV
ncbi:AAA family ATPase [Pedobacter ginsenosidimutans]|nr:AAA family ATPase [Pedobacter ginsenosidimutans]